MTSSLRRTASALVVLVAAAAGLAVISEPASAAPEEKVTICHRTNSRTNPYNHEAVAKSSAVDGHASHTGPIFGPDVDNWGDIIPPIRPGLPNGLNWNAAGRAILDNGCEMEPDVGPLPSATIGDATCTAGAPTVDVTVSNSPEATDDATFTIRVDGADVRTVGPIAPGDDQTVTLTGAPEDEIATIDVLSGGEVVASKVVTADCAPGPPAVTLQAALDCSGQEAQADVTVTDNGPDPIEVELLVDGSELGTVTVAPGETEEREFDASSYEGEVTTAQVVVDGTTVATFTLKPDCVPPVPTPAASVAGTVCPPPSATVTLSNTGDPDSKVVFGIRVDGNPVQASAPLYGGDTTTIVVDLSPYEDETVHVQAGYNGDVVVDRTLTVDCKADPDEPGTGPDGPDGGDPGTDPDAGALPGVGAGFPIGVVGLGFGLVTAGAVLLAAGARVRR